MLNIYNVVEVGKDSIVLRDKSTAITITFADCDPRVDEIATTKEEQANLFRVTKRVGLEPPVVPILTKQTIDIFLVTDSSAAAPSLFPISSLTVARIK